jgi:ubiquinone/menaquinone biosynthesis C-methylase UbiE
MDDERVSTVRADYDRIAADYAQHIYHELEAKPFDCELLRRFAAEVVGRGEACDIGCGPGHIARFLHEAGVKVFGLDLSPQMIEQARKLNPGISFREGNMMALDLADRSLTGIAAFYAIVNIPPDSLPTVFHEMARVLQPGGLLLLAFHIGSESAHPEALWGQPVSMEFFFFEPEAIRRLLGEAGFAIDKTIERAPYAPEVEYQSRRAYIFARNATIPAT